MEIKEITEKSSGQKQVERQTLTPAEADAAFASVPDATNPLAEKIASMPGGGFATFWCRDNPADDSALESGSVMAGDQKHLAMSIVITLVRKHPDMAISVVKHFFDAISYIQSRTLARALFQSILDFDELKNGPINAEDAPADAADKE